MIEEEKLKAVNDDRIKRLKLNTAKANKEVMLGRQFQPVKFEDKPIEKSYVGIQSQHESAKTFTDTHQLKTLITSKQYPLRLEQNL